MYTEKIFMKETTKEDLSNVMELWNNGNVMFYVGFPDGLGITLEELEVWLQNINQDNLRKHYSIYTEEIGYCGESFYDVDKEHDLATLDIKLLPKAQGKGIAEYALRYVINQVFTNKLASRAYVDPNPDNKKAWKLYNKIGFVSKPRPEFLEEYDVYLEITPELYQHTGILNSDGFDQWAPQYDQTVFQSNKDNSYPFAGYEDILENIYNRVVIDNSLNPINILDIGFGTGTLTSKLYDAGCNITGIDFSDKMIELAMEKMPNSLLLKWDFNEGLPNELDNHKFDFIISTYALHHIDDDAKIKLLHALKTYLCENGTILIGDVSFETSEQFEEFKELHKNEWDEEEYYMIYSSLSKHLDFKSINYNQISHCAGVLEINM